MQSPHPPTPISQQTLDDGERRASRPLQRKTRPLAPPRRPPGEKDHPSPRRSRGQSAPQRDQRLSHHLHKRAAAASRASSSRTALRPPSRSMTAAQSRFGPRRAPPGVRHAGLPAHPRAVCGVCGGRADGRAIGAARRAPRAPGVRAPGRAAQRRKTALARRRGPRRPRRARAGAGASRARPARRGRVCGRWRRARRRFRRIGASGAGSALKSG